MHAARLLIVDGTFLPLLVIIYNICFYACVHLVYILRQEILQNESVLLFAFSPVQYNVGRTMTLIFIFGTFSFIDKLGGFIHVPSLNYYALTQPFATIHEQNAFSYMFLTICRQNS